MSMKIRYQLQRGEFLLDVDFQLPVKGISALFGPSGCGKTTCLRCIAGLEKPQQGFFMLGDQGWQDSAQSHFIPAYQRAVGYVFQDAALFPHLNVQANLLYGYKRLRNRAAQIKPDEMIDLLRLSKLLDRSVENLSGGERQRVAIGRALLGNPDLLLMDEPLSALDASSKAEIMPCLEQLHQQLSIPILYVSHSADEVAQLADQIVLMDKGRVVAQGPSHEILTRLDLSLAQSPEASAIIDATIESHDNEFSLSRLAFSDQHISLPILDLAAGQGVRIIIHARDVSLALEHHANTSILNILPVEVEAISEINAAQMLVRLSVGGQKLLSRITRKSASVLELKIGQRLYAQVKSVSLL
ncbi:Molybdenum ABC transporter ATP-binding protein ModC [hydrothermal vent metagenome]|uniref:Molybdenum ABC transporter ATP-binding protein ModC n=1 Tax=hydrothermal vent metagenome TaxID=652676 RepID=A0A3B1BIR0_9ZZZZ